MNAYFNTSRTSSIVCINGKIYSRIEGQDGNAFYSVTCKGGIIRQLNTSAICARIDAAIIELAHKEALEEDEGRNWASIPTELKQVHGQRVRYGIELASATGVNVLEACHTEALKMNDAYNTLYVYAPGDAVRDVWEQMSDVEREVAVEICHANALIEDATFEENLAFLASPDTHELMDREGTLKFAQDTLTRLMNHPNGRDQTMVEALRIIKECCTDLPTKLFLNSQWVTALYSETMTWEDVMQPRLNDIETRLAQIGSPAKNVVITEEAMFNLDWQGVENVTTTSTDGDIKYGEATVTSDCGKFAWLINWKYDAGEFAQQVGLPAVVSFEGEAHLIMPDAVTIISPSDAEVTSAADLRNIVDELDCMYGWCGDIYNALNN